MKSPSVFLIILLIKARYAYCGSSFLHTVSVLQKIRDAYTSVKSFWENGMYRMDLDAFREQVKGCKLFILCNPHNSGGVVWTVD